MQRIIFAGLSATLALVATITPADVVNLNAGNLYVNIHSGNCGTCAGGEIRGQLLPSP